MTRSQQDKLTMWAATDAVLVKYQNIWPGIVAFANAVNLFRSIWTEIDPDAATQQQNNKGVTDTKSIIRLRLTENAQQLALNIKSYAFNKEDMELENQFTFTTTYFDRLRDNAIPIVADTILKKGTELRKELADYGVNEESLKELETSLKEFRTQSPAPKLKKDQRKQATINIAEKLEKGKKQLELMDNMAGNFKKKYPEFVNAFRGARDIIDLSHSKKAKRPADNGATKN